MEKTSTTLNSLKTPFFFIQWDRLVENCVTMKERAASYNAQFRPHVKTHKCWEIGVLQHKATPNLSYSAFKKKLQKPLGPLGPIVASTIAEVEYFLQKGFDNVCYGVPLTPHKLSHIASVALKAKKINPKSIITLLIDDIRVLKSLDKYSCMFGAFVLFDSGYHRAGKSGLEAEKCVDKILLQKNLIFYGSYTHAGHSYSATDPIKKAQIALEEIQLSFKFAQNILKRHSHLEKFCVSVGSTPTLTVPFDAKQITPPDSRIILEFHPGNYVFYDNNQVALHSCNPENVAVGVAARCIGSYPTHSICDAGALALSKDTFVGKPLYGKINKDSHCISLSQEVGKIDSPLLEYDSLLFIRPNHSCLTAACHRIYYIIQGEVSADSDVLGEMRPIQNW